MNKSTIILVALSGLSGFSLVYMWLTGWNPITAITGFISNPMGTVSSLISLVTQRLDIVAPVVAVASGAIAMGKGIINRVKSTAKDTENLLNGQLVEANQTAAKLEGTLKAVQTKVTEQTRRITELEAEKSKLNDKITEQTNTILRLQNDKKSLTKEEEDRLYERVVEKVRKH